MLQTHAFMFTFPVLKNTLAETEPVYAQVAETEMRQLKKKSFIIMQKGRYYQI